MTYDLREMVREAERTAAPFEREAVSLRCPAHPNREWQANWVGLLVCPDASHAPNRDGDE